MIGAPLEPEPSRWLLSARGAVPGEDVVAVGADLEPGTLLSAYRAGLFPMGLGPGGQRPWGWWSPDPRGVLAPGDLHVSRSLTRSLRRFEIRIDTRPGEVLQRCADLRRPGRWITPDIVSAYLGLHRLGWVHSVETWEAGALVGGLYGVSLGGLFAGESMFHEATDASKAALVALVDYLQDTDAGEGGHPAWLVDVQWRTDHLATLGVREVSRTAYLQSLGPLVRQRHRWPGALAPRAPSGPPRGPSG